MCRIVPSSLSLCSDCSISAAPEKLRCAGRGASHARNDAPRRSLTPKLRMCLHILAKLGRWGRRFHVTTLDSSLRLAGGVPSGSACPTMLSHTRVKHPKEAPDVDTC